MKFLLRNWYNLSGILALILIVVLWLLWGDLSLIQRLLFSNFIVIHIHVWEEFGFPGGFPKFANTLMIKGSPRPECYPLNQMSAMVGNWFFAFVFYLIPVFFEDAIWFGLMPMLFGIAQVIMHGIINNIQLRQWYNPGLGAALLGHLPIAIYYIKYIHSNRLGSLMDWVIAIVYMIFAYVIVFRKLIIGSLQNIDSPYPFAEEELVRFDYKSLLTRD